MNLGTGRIIVIVALVVGGVALLANGFGDSTSVAAPTRSPSTGAPSTSSPTPTPTASSPVATPAPNPPGKTSVAVFNATTTLGLAAQAQDVLDTAGYVKGQEPANAPVSGAAKTVVYYRGGADEAQNASDAHEIADTYFDGAKVAKLGPTYESKVPPDVQVVVVLGQDYADANPT